MLLLLIKLGFGEGFEMIVLGGVVVLGVVY